MAEQLRKSVSWQDADSELHSAARSGLARVVLVHIGRDVDQELMLLGGPRQCLPPLSTAEVVQVSAITAC